MRNISGRFTKITDANNSVVVGLIGTMTDENTTYGEILKIAGFYNISTNPDTFGYHFITKEGVIKRLRPDIQPLNNYNGFLEIFK